MGRKGESIFYLSSDEFNIYLNNIKSFVDSKSREAESDYFTLHDSTHCRAIEHIIADMVDTNASSLEEIEKFLLLAAVWCHDLGMFKGIADEYFEDAQNNGEMILNTPRERRKIHEKISAWYLSEHYREILLKRHMFNWDEIFSGYSEERNAKLIEFLTQNFGIKCGNKPKIEKNNCDNTIMVFNDNADKNCILLKLNKEKTEVIMEIDGVSTDEFVAKGGNDGLNIYLKQEDKRDKIDLKQKDKIDIVDDSKLRNYIRIINIIIKYHRRSTFIDECPLEIFLEKKKIKCRLLSALLRLGDTLHIDSTRYDDERFHILQMGSLNRESMLHWLKSYLISNIFLDKNNQAIIINLDLPEKRDRVREGDWRENIANLENLIIKEIQADAISVFEIFEKNNLSTYTKVQINKIFIPGFDSEKYLQICGVLSDLGLSVSPNSSRAIMNALNSIKYLPDTDGNHNQIKELIRWIEGIYQGQLSHFGLKRVIDGLKDISEKSDKQLLNISAVDNVARPSSEDENASDISKNQLKDNLKYLFDKILIFRREAEKQIYQKENLKEMSKKDLIFLHGYSATILNYLKNCSLNNPSFLDRAHFYVCEGSTKRKYTINNQIEYNDGINYAIHLSNLGFKNIDIIPDISFASIIARLEEKQDLGDDKKLERAVLLFGANGIVNHIMDIKPDNDLGSGELKKVILDVVKDIHAKEITSGSIAIEPIMVDINTKKINFFGISDNKKLYLIRKEDNEINVYNVNSGDYLFSIKDNAIFEDPEDKVKLKDIFMHKDILLSTDFKIIKGQAYDDQEDAWEIAYGTDAYIVKGKNVKGKVRQFDIYYKNKGICILSSGHLALALMAKKLGIDVFVVADSFKKGKRPERDIGKRYWLHSQFENWLTTQSNYVQEIEKRQIKLTNYREDELPMNIITKIISDELVW